MDSASLNTNQSECLKQKKDKSVEATGVLAENKPSPLFVPAPVETTGSLASSDSSSNSSSGSGVSYSA